MDSLLAEQRLPLAFLSLTLSPVYTMLQQSVSEEEKEEDQIIYAFF